MRLKLKLSVLTYPQRLLSHLLWAVLELMVFVGSDRSGGLGRCGASTLALSQLIDLNILEFHTPFKSPCNSLNPQGTIVF